MTMVLQNHFIWNQKFSEYFRFTLGANLHESIQIYCFKMEHISDIINEQ